VFPIHTSSRHVAIPPPRDEGGFTLLSNFRSPVSGLRSPVSKFSTSYFLISTSQRERLSAFTLLELLVVMAIIAILMVLIVPAFTTIKAGNDVTAAAYTIKGVLDTACTYAKSNNTYTWVGFCEENVASTTPGCGGIGRIVMWIVASKDGTNVATTNPIDPTKLIQVGKLTKIDNLHLATFTDGSGTGSTFDTRPPITFNGTQYTIANMANSTTPFQYPVGNPAPTAQYTFVKAVQFGPNGVAHRFSSDISVGPPKYCLPGSFSTT
jgi:prepilin-type N-terminal cleavage/methylation domain-containing protein